MNTLTEKQREALELLAKSKNVIPAKTGHALEQMEYVERLSDTAAREAGLLKRRGFSAYSITAEGRKALKR